MEDYYSNNIRSWKGSLAMPIDFAARETTGTIGMHFNANFIYSITNILYYIKEKSKNYPKYQSNIWDCEDFAFLAAADIRCRFPGQPTAIALGTAIDRESGNSVDYAVNVIWFNRKEGGQTKCETRFIDLTEKIFMYTFDTRILIPLPISGLSDHKELPPFENLGLIESAAFQLDRREYKFNLINTEVMNTLKDAPAKCPEQSEIGWSDFNRRFWTISDRVFYAFAHIRKKHQGAPVGVAFGIAALQGMAQGFDYAALIIWNNPYNYFYWDVNEARNLEELDIKFKPRIVIV
jgi:hypothetical protein